MQKNHSIGVLACLGATGLIACSDPGGNTETLETPQTARQPLTGPGTVIADDERPEVVHLPGCSGTLIHRYFVITGAHCGWAGPLTPGGQSAQFYVKDAQGILREFDVTIDRAVQIHAVATSLLHPSGFRWGADTSLLRLKDPAPASVTPASIAIGSPYTGQTCTTYGYGAHSANGLDGPCDVFDNHKRHRDWPFPPPAGYGTGACGGDSGGPSFLEGAPGGDIFATTITFNGLANLPLLSEEILEQIRLMKPDPGTGKVENWVSGADRPGYDLPVSPVSVPSTAACQTACITTDQCRAWSYIPAAQQCWLKGAIQRWVPSDGAITGIRPAIEDGFKRVGNVWATTQPVASAQACRWNCGSNRSSCGSFTYDSTTKVCSLFSNAPSPVAQAAGETKQSGLPPGTGDSVHREALDYMPAIPNLSATDCRQRCANDYFCQSYSFNPGDGTCHLKDGAGGLISSTTEKSGIRRRPALPGVRFTGTVVSGTSAEYVPTPLTGTQYSPIDLCVSDCEKNSSCMAYTVKHHVPGDFLRCTLYSAIAAEIPIVDGDDPEVGLARQVTSGYRGDTFY